MTERSIAHATFKIERTFAASPQQVYAAWADPAAKAAWFRGPEEKGQKYSLDFRLGGTEHSSGAVNGKTTYTYDAVIQNIVPNERIVYSYHMTIDGKPISVSLSTVELSPEGTGTRMRYSETGAFLDGLDKVEFREHGTKDLLDKLDAELERRTKGATVDTSNREIVSSRVFDAPVETVYAAFADPEQLRQWWGPKGFSNIFETFDLKPGGEWRFIMHSPDGRDFPNYSVFREIADNERIVFDHVGSVHRFEMRLSFARETKGTRFTMHMVFDSPAEREAIERYIVEGNTENLDRLGAALQRRAA
jgi:uncharacterized protein YndB with AHSA1/START domain